MAVYEDASEVLSLLLFIGFLIVGCVVTNCFIGVMIVAIEGVKRLGLILLSSKKELLKLKLLQSGQTHEHEECIHCLYSLSSIAQHCVFIQLWQWSEWIALWLFRTSLWQMPKGAEQSEQCHVLRFR